MSETVRETSGLLRAGLSTKRAGDKAYVIGVVIPETDFIGGIDRLRLLVLAIALATLVAALAATDFIARRLEAETRERHRTTDRLSQQLSLTQTIIDALPNPVFYQAADTRLVGLNTAFEACFGVDRSHMIGKRSIDLEFLSEQDRRAYQAEDERLINSREGAEYEKDFVFSDGKTHPTLYMVNSFAAADGGPGGLVGVIIDLTRLKEAEARLRDQERMLGMVLASVAVGIAAYDRERRLLFWNENYARFIGLSDAHLKPGCDFRTILQAVAASSPGDSNDPYRTEDAIETRIKAVFSGQPVQTERSIGGRDLDVHSAPALDGSAAIALTDITERKVMENELLEARKTAQEATQSLSHRVHDLNGRRILVVDDHPTAREVLSGHLTELGCIVHQAPSGREALDELRAATLPFDVILLDWKMPEMDGLETARAIRAESPQGTRTRLVMVSAYGGGHLLENAEQAGLRVSLAANGTEASKELDPIHDTLWPLITRLDKLAVAEPPDEPQNAPPTDADLRDRVEQVRHQIATGDAAAADGVETLRALLPSDGLRSAALGVSAALRQHDKTGAATLCERLEAELVQQASESAMAVREELESLQDRLDHDDADAIEQLESIRRHGDAVQIQTQISAAEKAMSLYDFDAAKEAVSAALLRINQRLQGYVEGDHAE